MRFAASHSRIVCNFNPLSSICLFFVPHSRKRLEVELIPIKLRLKAWVTILWFIHLDKTLWHWQAPAFRGTIWEKQYRKDDLGPPTFPYCDEVAEQW